MLVLIDTNVLLDFYLQRQPFFMGADLLVQSHHKSIIQGYVSATTVTDLYYQLRRDKTFRPFARSTIGQIIATFGIVEVNKPILQVAERMQGYDFEDDIQIACAMILGAQAIVTRDKKGFRNAPLPILTPTALVAQLKAQGHKL